MSRRRTGRSLSPAAAAVVELAPASSRAGASSLSALASRLFLPAGYPGSVSSDYAAFQAWDSVQGLCSYIRGTISTAALLEAVGVGRADATAASATLTFLFRGAHAALADPSLRSLPRPDLAGHVGSLAFSAAHGSAMDGEAKQFRFLADVANNMGLWLNLCAPLLPRQLFLLVACVASVAHAVTGVAGGATRAALTQHFALCGNAADVASKEAAQETAVTLVGMLCGGLVLRAAAASVRLSWSVFALLTALHLAANARAMRALRLTLLNRTQLDVLLRACAEGLPEQPLSPAQAAAREPLLPSALQIRRPRRLRLGVPLAHLPGPPLAAGAAERPFVARLDARGAICVALRAGGGAAEAARAVTHALCAQRRAAAAGGREAALAEELARAPASDAEWARWLAALTKAGWVRAASAGRAI